MQQASARHGKQADDGASFTRRRENGASCVESEACYARAMSGNHMDHRERVQIVHDDMRVVCLVGRVGHITFV